MRKKVITILLTALCLTGCGQKSDDVPAGNETKELVVQTPEPSPTPEPGNPLLYGGAYHISYQYDFKMPYGNTEYEAEVTLEVDDDYYCVKVRYVNEAMLAYVDGYNYLITKDDEVFKWKSDAPHSPRIPTTYRVGSLHDTIEYLSALGGYTEAFSIDGVVMDEDTGGVIKIYADDREYWMNKLSSHSFKEENYEAITELSEREAEKKTFPVSEFMVYLLNLYDADNPTGVYMKGPNSK